MSLTDLAACSNGKATDLLAAALDYAGRNYPVFPCVPGAKKPITQHGFHESTTDAVQIRCWWAATPTANIGVPTAGLIVVDIDGAENPWPIDSQQRADLEIAPIAITPHNGRHYIFRQPAGRNWRNTTSRLAPRVDTRGDGGYIVVAPSMTSDGSYRWLTPLPAAQELSEPPAWLATQLDALAKSRTKGAGTNRTMPNGTLPHYVKAALDSEAGRVAIAREGTRNDTLVRAAYSLGGLVGTGALDRDIVETALTEAARRCGLQDREIAATLRSGLEAGIATPRTIPPRCHGVPSLVNPTMDAAAATVKTQSCVEIIRNYLMQKYQPTFRRGPVIYSALLGREVSRSELIDAPGSDLIDALQAGWDFPRSEHGPHRNAVPRTFRSWAPIAWHDIMATLPDEHESPEIVESAAEQFRAAVADALMTMESFSYHSTREGRGEVQRRSLISWCQLWARVGPWQSVRSLALWCRQDAERRLCVAIHVRLWGQIRRGGVMTMSQRKFGQLAQCYGVGRAGKAGGSRAIELLPEYVAGLLASPADEEMDGNLDENVDEKKSGDVCAPNPPTSAHPSTAPSTDGRGV